MRQHNLYLDQYLTKRQNEKYAWYTTVFVAFIHTDLTLAETHTRASGKQKWVLCKNQTYAPSRRRRRVVAHNLIRKIH